MMFEPYQNQPGELEEARRIVGRLAAAFERMRPGDQRLWRTWRCHLIRRGSEARIGPHRLKLLRDLWARYGVAKAKMKAAA